MKKVASQKRQDKVEKSWIKFVRFLIYVVSIIGVTVGASLIKVGGLSVAYADGTYAVKIENGEIIFFVSLVILYGNIMWGILRWFLRGYQEKWKPGRIVGKLIGGGIWRVLAIVPLVVLSLLIISGWVSGLIGDKSKDSGVNALNIVSRKISEDYNAGRLSLDDYVKYLLDALYDNEKLPEKYKDGYTDIDNKVFEVVADNFNMLDNDIISDFYKKITLADVGFDSEQAAAESLLSANAYAADGTVTIAQNFDGARLTRNEHFVIFYENYGDVAQKIDFIGDVLEDAIDKYHSIFGQNWYYHPVRHGGDSKEKRESDFKQLLSKNDISENILDTAMPVYIFDTGESYVAQRVGTSVNGFTKILAGLVDNPGNDIVEKTTFSFPYIIMQSGAVLKSSDVAIKEVLVHELSHHYVDAFCRSNSPIGAPCSGLDDFASEAFAQYMASEIVEGQEEGDFLNSHHNNYVELATCHKINEILGLWDNGECSYSWYEGTNLGYSATAFFENYADFVPDFNDVIFRIAASTDTDSVFQYVNGTSNLLELLYNKAGSENFTKAVVQLAQRNLTNDYGDKKSFYAVKIPPGQDLPCLDFCSKGYDLEPISSKYYYFSMSDNIGAVYYKAGDSFVSVLGKDLAGAWNVLYTSRGDGQIKISEYASDYEVLALIVTNCDFKNDGYFELNVFSKQFIEMLDDLGDLAETSENVYIVNNADCQEMNIESLFDLPTRIFDFGISAANFIGIHSQDDNFNGVKSDLEKEKGNYINETAGLVDELSGYRISICQSKMDGIYDFDAMKETLQKAMGWNMAIYDERDGADRMSVFFGFDLLTRQGRIYVLAESEGEVGLITINVSEK